MYMYYDLKTCRMVSEPVVFEVLISYNEVYKNLIIVYTKYTCTCIYTLF